MDRAEHERCRKILTACWRAFDGAALHAAGVELRKGPRGGGRDLQKIKHHVLEADQQYLRRLAWKHKIEEHNDLQAELERMRAAVLDALASAERGALPQSGPRGGKIWTPRYFVRRTAWHVLDHTWEIEERME